MSEEHRFNPNEHLMQIKSKAGSSDYLPVQWRLVWFREQCPTGTIDTQEVIVDLDREVEEEVYVWNSEKRRSEKVIKRARGYARFKTVATDGRGGRATGTKSENAASFPDFVEKAETGSIGRALAALGYGTQFTGDEFDESHRIVDSPVDHPSNGNGSNHANSSNGSAKGSNAPRDENAEATVTEQQVASIRKLCQHLGKSEPDNMTSISYLAAKKLIGELTTEYKASRQPSPSPSVNSQKPEPASKELLASARQMYQKLGREVPADLDKKSAHVIKELMEQMTGAYRDLLNQQKGQAPTTQTSQPTSVVNAPDALSLRKRCSQMRLNWDDLLTTHLGAVKTLDNIIPEECAKLKEALDIIEETRLKRAIDQQKAS